ncbi:hypothetical protein MMPV_005345 [Pyropia vietnamensis]
MPLERERGITIKARAVLMRVAATVPPLWAPGVNGGSSLPREPSAVSVLSPTGHPPPPPANTYHINLLDTPGHSDFSHEASRVLAAVEAALLLVDASQGPQAQTLAVVAMARAAGVPLLPVLTKVDMPAADVPGVAAALARLTGTPVGEVVVTSARTGEGVDDLLAAILTRVPPPLVGGQQPAPATTVYPLAARVGTGTGVTTHSAPSSLAHAPASALVSKTGEDDLPLRALVFDSRFDPFRGVVMLLRVVSGRVRKGDRVVLMHGAAKVEAEAATVAAEEGDDEDVSAGFPSASPMDSWSKQAGGGGGGGGGGGPSVHVVDSVGVLSPTETPTPSLGTGEIGYVTAALRRVHDARVGDTLTHAAGCGQGPAAAPLPGYARPRPVVYCGLYLSPDGGGGGEGGGGDGGGGDYAKLRAALAKLQLNDASLTYAPHRSPALGVGVRVGALGLLHLDVVQARLEREFGLALTATAPSVSYRVHDGAGPGGGPSIVATASDLPSSRSVAVDEPFVKCEILVPDEHVGAVMELAQGRRGELEDMRYLADEVAGDVSPAVAATPGNGSSGDRDARGGDAVGAPAAAADADAGQVLLCYWMPLASLVCDFDAALASRSRGYASMSHGRSRWRRSDVVRMDVLVAGQPVDGLACVAHASEVSVRARTVATKLRDALPRQLFKVAVQVAVGGRVIASEHISAMSKNVLAKCYGGDITRKKKLLKKQQAGKKRMQTHGRVVVPQAAYLAVLQRHD